MKIRKRAEPSKPPAEERTAPLFVDENGGVACPICAAPIALSKVTMRADGTPECPACGAPLPKELGGPGRTLADVSVSDPAPKAKPVMLPKIYCNECGTEWPRVQGRPFPNCGHADGFVDDPGKARHYNPPAGHPRLELVSRSCRAPSSLQSHDDAHVDPGQRAAPDAAPASREVPGGSVVLRREPQRLVAEWGKTNFMIQQYSSMGVGPFSLSADVPDGADAKKVGEALLDDLEKLADEAFERQLAWYLRKLGVVRKEFG